MMGLLLNRNSLRTKSGVTFNQDLVFYFLLKQLSLYGKELK
jgi:hypothetical protein